jgi:zinc protease
MKRKITVKMFLAMLLIIVASGFAPKKEGEKDRKAEKILHEFVEATGGEKAIANIESLISKSQLEFVESGFILKREIFETRANQCFIKVNSPQTGDIYRGYNGKQCWEKRQAQLREIVGEEKQSFLNTSAFLRFANWQQNLAAYQYAGKTNVAGITLHRIDVKTIYGAKESWYFNADDHLLGQMEEPLDLPESSATATTSFSDYRDVNGVKLSFAQTIAMPGQTRKISFSEITANRDIDNNLFSPPGKN